MEKPLNKLLITRWGDQILTALTENGKFLSFNLEPAEQTGLLGNIYIGKVKNIVKNINSAFIDLGNGQTGYYSLTDNKTHLFADSAWKLCQEKEEQSSGADSPDTCSETETDQEMRPLRQGDEILVQVERDAVKTKDPVLTSNLNFTGKYLVLTHGKKQIGFSGKIRDKAWKQHMQALLEKETDRSFGLIVRTNAKEAAEEEILQELAFLSKRRRQLLTAASHRTCYSLLASSEPAYISSIRDAYKDELDAVMTDDKACYEALRQYMEEHQSEDLHKLSFYEDPLISLPKLYSLETAMEQALGKHVWLKSGGYLVIEPTEALTVIDVNTGKYTGKKTQAETILKINLEAASETARQLRLRNLSGIIVVDFIDMETEAHQMELMSLLERELSRDPVKTALVDMTRLGLVEITRKKVKRPLAEQVKAAGFLPGKGEKN